MNSKSECTHSKRCGLDSNGAPGEDVIVDNNGNRVSVDLTLHGFPGCYAAGPHEKDVIAGSRHMRKCDLKLIFQ